MKRLIGLASVALALLLSAPPAHAQTRSALTVTSCPGSALWTPGAAGALTVDANGLLCVNASVSASISGFAPGGTYATLTATASSASVALPAGAVVVFQNSGTTAVSCTLGVGSATATASKNIIQPASWMAFTVGSNTFGACIDQTGSASNVVVLSGGAGLPTGAGGGSSSGGGGAATIIDGGDVAEGTTTDGACAGDATSGCTVLSRLSRIAARLTTILGTGIPVTNANTNGQATKANSSPVVLASDQTAADPCMFQAKTTVPISTSSGGPVSLVALSGSTKVYVCSIAVITDTAIKLSFIDGTGGSCASAQHAIWGSTTAANGMSLAANGGFSEGNGQGTVGATAAASALCLLQSGTSLVAGNLTYVQQ